MRACLLFNSPTKHKERKAARQETTEDQCQQRANTTHGDSCTKNKKTKQKREMATKQQRSEGKQRAGRGSEGHQQLQAMSLACLNQHLLTLKHRAVRASVTASLAPWLRVVGRCRAASWAAAWAAAVAAAWWGPLTRVPRPAALLRPCPAW